MPRLQPCLHGKLHAEPWSNASSVQPEIMQLNPTASQEPFIQALKRNLEAAQAGFSDLAAMLPDALATCRLLQLLTS